LVLEQPVQPDDPDAGVKLPLLLKPQADMRRLTFVPLQWGQLTSSSLLKTRVSKASLQLAHLYS
jgi:hypothetical protein